MVTKKAAKKTAKKTAKKAGKKAGVWVWLPADWLKTGPPFLKGGTVKKGTKPIGIKKGGKKSAKKSGKKGNK